MDKTLDSRGRWRNITVAFRMSKPESDDLNTRVQLSSLTKQDYIINRLLCRDVVVVGNPRVYKALRNQMKLILDELKRLDTANDADTDFLVTLQLVAQILDEMRGD